MEDIWNDLSVDKSTALSSHYINSKRHKLDWKDYMAMDTSLSNMDWI